MGSDRHLREVAPQGERRLKVVAIDDHPTYVRGVAALLEALAPELEVLPMCDPVEGLQLVVDEEPDVLLLDLHMPAMRGLDVLKKARAVAPETKVLLLTVSEAPEDVAEAMRAGARGYLSKDVEAEDLASAIRAVAAGKVVLTGFAAETLVENEERHVPLSDAQIHLARLISSGRTYGEIARDLAVSESTLKRQLIDIQKKLGVTSKLQMIAQLARRGLL